MICDTLAAGMIYKGKDWYQGYQLEYYEKRKDKEYINNDIKKVLEDVYRQVSKKGINKTINKNNLKKTYNKYIKT